MRILCCIPTKKKQKKFIYPVTVCYSDPLKNCLFPCVFLFTHMRGEVKNFPANDLFTLKGRNSDNVITS